MSSRRRRAPGQVVTWIGKVGGREGGRNREVGAEIRRVVLRDRMQQSGDEIDIGS